MLAGWRWSKQKYLLCDEQTRVFCVVFASCYGLSCFISHEERWTCTWSICMRRGQDEDILSLGLRNGVTTNKVCYIITIINSCAAVSECWRRYCFPVVLEWVSTNPNWCCKWLNAFNEFSINSSVWRWSREPLPGVAVCLFRILFAWRGIAIQKWDLFWTAKSLRNWKLLISNHIALRISCFV